MVNEDQDFAGPEEDFLGPLDDAQLVAHGVVNYEWTLVAVLCVLLLCVWAATALVWYFNARILTRVYSHPEEFEIHADRIAASCRDVVAGVDIKALSKQHSTEPAAPLPRAAVSPVQGPPTVRPSAPSDASPAAASSHRSLDALARAQLDIRTAVDMQRMAATPFIAPERDEEHVLHLRSRLHRDTIGDERDADAALIDALDDFQAGPAAMVHTPAGNDSVAGTPAASAAQQLLRAMEAVTLMESSGTLRHRRMGRGEQTGSGLSLDAAPGASSASVPVAALDSTRLPHHMHASLSFSSVLGGVE